MKSKLFLFSVLTSFMMDVHAQQDSIYTFYQDTQINACTDLNIQREIQGGTTFIVDFEGDWKEDMKGAFRYACKIWEEALPTMLPIRIKAQIGNLRGSGTNLSKVLYNKLTSVVNRHSQPQSRFIMLEEYNHRHNYFYRAASDTSELNRPDIEITYNQNLLNLDNVSFSLEAASTTKVDFVTQVLRDIATGLGFSYRFIPAGGELAMPDTVPCYGLEMLIKESMNTTSGTVAYQKATQGSLPITISGYGTLQLYAPSYWQNGVSLNTFYPSDWSGLSKLMTYDFGKGTVIRDIEDSYYTWFFNGFDWKYSLPVGVTSSSVIDRDFANSDVVDYHGVISESSTSMLTGSNDIITSSNTLIQMQTESTRNMMSDEVAESEIRAYCKPYDPTLDMNDNIDHEGWTFSLLKKDGTWDVVYEANSGVTYFTLNTSNLTLHYADEDYARSTDNFLRGRLTYNERLWDSWHNHQYNKCYSKYYVLDYLPQKVEMDTARVYEDSYLQDEYLYDIDMAMSNLEGATAVYVEQLEEGDQLPSIRRIYDFKKGRFLVTVDREYASTFTVVAYNDNGHTRSETYTVAPSSPAQVQLNIIGNYIETTYGHKNKGVTDISYEIYTFNNNLLQMNNTPYFVQNGQSADGRIDMGKLKSGLNIVTVTLQNGKKGFVSIMKNQ